MKVEDMHELVHLNDYLASTTAQKHFKDFPQLEGACLTLHGHGQEDLDENDLPFETEWVQRFELHVGKVTISGTVPDLGPAHWYDKVNGDQPHTKVLHQVLAHIVSNCGAINWGATK